MIRPCVFKALAVESYEVDLGVVDSRGAPCMATVCLTDGAFLASKVRGGSTHMTEPGMAYRATVRHRQWQPPAVLYFRSVEDRRRYIDNRIEALTVLVVAKYS